MPSLRSWECGCQDIATIEPRRCRRPHSADGSSALLGWRLLCGPFSLSEVAFNVLSFPNNPETSYKKRNTKHDGHVGDVEDARPDWTDADVQKIHYATVHDSIDEIRKPSSEQQPQPDESHWPESTRKRGDDTPDQKDPGTD